MANGQALHQKQNATGNPILIMHLYEVEWPGGEMMELAANIIIESMYVQCDVNRNEHL